MSFENPLNKLPAKKPEAANDNFDIGPAIQLTREEIEAGGDPYRDSEGRETFVSADGILNRALMNRRAAERRESERNTRLASEEAQFDESQFVRRGVQPESFAEAEGVSVAQLEQQISEKEIVLESSSDIPNEQLPVEKNYGWGRPEEKLDSSKPYFTQLIEHFTASGFDDPYAEALDELKSNVDPKITDPRQQGEIIVSFLKEHREYKDRQDS
jgi:hypothetical protein